MAEGERKLCLVEPPLELMEEMPLQVQMQLLEKMQDMEALEAEEGAEARGAMATFLVRHQEQMEASVEREALEAEVEREEWEGMLMIPLQEQEIQEVLAALEGEAEAAEMLGWVQVLMEKEIMVVMVEQEVMAEVEGAAVLNIKVEVVVAAALVVLD